MGYVVGVRKLGKFLLNLIHEYSSSIVMAWIFTTLRGEYYSTPHTELREITELLCFCLK
jgi:hypothetical protein